MAMPSPATAIEQAAIQEFSSRLTSLREDFANNLDRMQRIADRAFGPSPELNSAANPRAVPNGEIGAVRERLDDIASICSSQRTVLNRLDTIV